MLDMCTTERQRTLAKIALWEEQDLEGYFSKGFFIKWKKQLYRNKNKLMD